MVLKKKRASTGADTPRRVPGNHPPSIIAADMHVLGDLEGEGELHVDGRVDGNIRCGEVTIGRTGDVKGKVMAREVNVMGTLVGTIEAIVSRLMRTCKVIGDVTHERLEMEPGATVNGYYHNVDRTTITKSLASDGTRRKALADRGENDPPAAPESAAASES